MNAQHVQTETVAHIQVLHLDITIKHIQLLMVHQPKSKNVADVVLQELEMPPLDMFMVLIVLIHQLLIEKHVQDLDALPEHRKLVVLHTELA
jgi:hypothetical protein